MSKQPFPGSLKFSVTSSYPEKKEAFVKSIDDKIKILGEIIDLLTRLRELVD